jgi:hypothetical protein
MEEEELEEQKERRLDLVVAPQVVEMILIDFDYAFSIVVEQT